MLRTMNDEQEPHGTFQLLLLCGISQILNVFLEKLAKLTKKLLSIIAYHTVYEIYVTVKAESVICVERQSFSCLLVLGLLHHNQQTAQRSARKR